MFFYKPFWLTVVLPVIVLFLSCSSKENGEAENPVVARVNNTVLTREDANQLLLSQENAPVTLEAVISQWINEELLYQAAVQKDLQKDRHLETIVTAFRRNLLGNAFLESSVTEGAPISPEAVKAYYSDHKDSFVRLSDEVLVYHFVTEDETQARQIQRTLRTQKSGGERKELFSTYRVDAITVKKGFLIKPLDEALFSSSKASTLVGPIKTDAGYHVIEVLSRYKAGSQIGLDEAYDEIYQRLLNQKLALRSVHILDSLRNEAHIEFIPEGHQ